MAKFVGFSGRSIHFVTDGFVKMAGNLLAVPEDLQALAPEVLMNQYEVWKGKILPKGHVHDPKQLKVAFVGVYQIPCGISTYSEWLFPQIHKHVADYRIFAERSEDSNDSDPKIVRCWKRGEPLSELIHQIREYDPDVVLVQHEYGIFPSARYWLSFITKMQRYRTIVTLHSVYNHKDKTICEAPIPEIVVHTEIAKQTLAKKGIEGKVHVIPHGCLPVENPEKFWNIYHSKHTLMQFGFGFRYKGWENSLRAVHELKKKYPDIFFTGLFSESPLSRTTHDQYYAELEELITELGIEENVAIARGFVHQNVLEAYLRTNQVAIFPYIENGEHTVFGCSGAARIAMRCNVPTVVSQVPLFYDLEGVCPRTENIDELCHEIGALWTDAPHKEKQLIRQQSFLMENSWENVGQKYIELMTRG